MEVTPDANEADVVLCIRVSDARLRAEGSHVEKCCKCDEDVLVAPSSPVEIPKVCIQCLVEDV